MKDITIYLALFAVLVVYTVETLINNLPYIMGQIIVLQSMFDGLLR